MGAVVDYGDFLIVRPIKNYRINSGVIIIKGEEPVIVDTGSSTDPGIGRIRAAFKINKIDPDSVKYVIVTHSHQDHATSLWQIENFCKNAKAICHANEFKQVQNPTRMPKAWSAALKLLGRPKWVQNLYNYLSIPMLMLFYRTIHIHARLDYVTNYETDSEHFSLDDCPKLETTDNEFTIIPTHGHSEGHISVLDKNGNLYLGDFLPFTPWVNPNAEALDKMIDSTEILLSIPDSRIKRAIRSHGDIRRDRNYRGKLHDNGPWYGLSATWEVADWSEEKERFQYWLDKIRTTLERIPDLLTKPLTFYGLTKLIIPHYKNYSFIMRELFIPPAMTWILAYCLKLEKMGKIRRIKKHNYLYWVKA